ncbi:unnamed protein product [Aphanomyces euteiches]|nr:hypothetical protein AeRB84_011549 [Aphanomyces euteiches]
MASVAPVVDRENRPPPRVLFCRVSLLYTAFFIANLLAVPLKVYITETVPWRLPTAEFNSSRVLESFQELAQSSTKPLVRTTWGYVLRYTLDLPSSPATDCTHYMLQFPAALFYGPALRQLACNVMAHNYSTSSAFECESAYLGTLFFANACLWIEPAASASKHAAVVFTFGGTTHEPLMFCWFKFAARLAMSLSILRLMYHDYYRHYKPLVANLKTLGLLGERHAMYLVEMGDPAFLIFTNPWMTLLLGLHFYLDIVFVGLASVRTSQLVDFGEFCLGCLYCASLMWYGYLALRTATFFVKRYHWEAYCLSVDPGYLAFAATIYAGPLFYTLANTWFVFFIQNMLSWVPNPDPDRAIDVAPRTFRSLCDCNASLNAAFLVCVTVAVLHCVVPLGFAFGQPWLQRRRQVRQYLQGPPTALAVNYSTEEYNDIKVTFLKAMLLKIRKPQAAPNDHARHGGSIYHMYAENARYKRLPLLSHRASDCFVVCLNDDGNPVARVRLTLLHCLDRQENDPMRAIHICHSCQQTSSVCTIDESPKNSTQEEPSRRYVHQGARGCIWVV